MVRNKKIFGASAKNKWLSVIWCKMLCFNLNWVTGEFTGSLKKELIFFRFFFKIDRCFVTQFDVHFLILFTRNKVVKSGVHQLRSRFSNWSDEQKALHMSFSLTGVISKRQRKKHHYRAEQMTRSPVIGDMISQENLPYGLGAHNRAHCQSCASF